MGTGAGVLDVDTDSRVLSRPICWSDAVYFLDEYAGPQDVAVYRIRFVDEVPEVVARIPAEGRSITGFAAGAGVVFVALGDGSHTGRLWRADLP